MICSPNSCSSSEVTHTCEDLDPSSWESPWKYCKTAMKCSLLQAEQVQVPQLVFTGQLLQLLFMFLAFCWTRSIWSISSSYQAGQNWRQYSACHLRSAEQRKIITPSNILALLLLIQSWTLLAFLPARAHCRFMFSLLSTKTTVSFPVELLYSQCISSLYHCNEFFLPRCRIWHLSLLNFMKFFLAYSSCLSRFLCMLALLPGIWTGTSLVSSANKMRVRYIASSTPLIKWLNRTGLGTDPAVFNL